MILYLDTSAVVPLIVQEPTSAVCAQLWSMTEDVVSSRLVRVEAAAALAQAYRMGRLDRASHDRAVSALGDIVGAMDIVEIDAELADRAAVLADRLALRGYDTVHCASAERVRDPDLVVVSGDRRLLAALSALGLDTVDPAAA